MPFILTSHLILKLLLQGSHLTGMSLLLGLHLVSMMHILLLSFLYTTLFGGRSLSVHILDLILEFLDLCDEAALVLLL